MPHFMDTRTRVDDIVDAVVLQAALGGMAAVSYRNVARLVGISHSTLHDHFPERPHLLKVCTARLASARRVAIAGRVAREGLAGLVPSTDEELILSGAWMALRECGRYEPLVALEIALARVEERVVIARAVEGAAGASQPAVVVELVHLVVEALEADRCAGDEAISHPDAVDLLTQGVQGLASGLRTTDAA